MNIVEKILAQAAHRDRVSPGEIVEAQIDKAMMNDITGPLAIEAFQQMGGDRVWDPARVIVVLDHLVPANDDQAAHLHRLLRLFARDQGLPHFYDVGRGGVCHQVMVEHHVLPGEVIVGADSHTCTYGALGAFATGIGSTEIAAVLLTGQLWFKVPPVIQVVVEGALRPPVAPKDLILAVIGELGADGATYRGVEFAGPAVAATSVEGRMTLCNMVVEMGGKNGIVPPDEQTAAYVRSRGGVPGRLLRGDADAAYERVVEFNAAALEPMVALPPAVDHVKPVAEVGTIEVDQALLGSCTNGRIEDLRIAAAILRHRRVKEGVRALVIPASQAVYAQALREGVLDVFLQAGALVCNPNCGPCYGGHLGLLAAGETCVSTTNRNFVGRMGSPQARVYLASPATVAASAVTGRIMDPRQLEVSP